MEGLQKQYRDTKQAHPDAVVIMQLSGQYVCVGEDGLLVAKVLDLDTDVVAGGLALGVLLVIPERELANVIAGLVSRGHNVLFTKYILTKSKPDPAYAWVKGGEIKWHDQ